MSFLMAPYAFREAYCTMTRANGRVTFTGPCVDCLQPQSVEVDEAAAGRYQRGEFVQDCFPDLSASAREFLISGICGECWDKMFGQEEDDDAA